jgi:hypothetical protein
MKNSPGALAFHRDMMLDIRLSIVDLITLITVPRNSRQAIVDDSLRNADSITIIVSVNKSYSKSMLPTESTLATLALTMFSLSTSTELSQFDSMLPAPSNASTSDDSSRIDLNSNDAFLYKRRMAKHTGLQPKHYWPMTILKH